jgi:hypothetical protein
MLSKKADEIVKFARDVHRGDAPKGQLAVSDGPDGKELTVIPSGKQQQGTIVLQAEDFDLSSGRVA